MLARLLRKWNAAPIAAAVALTAAGLWAAASGPAIGVGTPAQAGAGGNGVGYWMAASDGGVYEFGTANLGDLRGQALNGSVVGMAATPDGHGYWLAGSDGGVFTFGDARFHGSAAAGHITAPIVGMAATPDGGGYWLVGADGTIYNFGDAGFLGSVTGAPAGLAILQPILGLLGSPTGVHLRSPIVGMAATPDGGGYWLVGANGSIFYFGDAHFYGSAARAHLRGRIVGMAATPDGGGYWLAGSDGGIFSFGDAPFRGSTGAAPGPAPVVAVAATSHGFIVPGNATGNDISWPQCGGPYPAGGQPISVVGVTNGYIGVSDPYGDRYGPNPCYSSEAEWAGPNMLAYQVAAPINGANGNLANATAGPEYCPSVSATPACNYNWGWNSALQAVGFVHSRGTYPNVWWMDIELDEGWNFATPGLNAQVVQGMIDAVRSLGLTPGVYATNYQWGKITGGYPLRGIPTWIAGAGNVYSGTYSAYNFCAQPGFDFGGGIPRLVQYGYAGSGYSGPYPLFDEDYSCPNQ